MTFTSPRPMTGCVVVGTANRGLALAVADHLGVEPVSCEVERFPDGELRPAVEGVRGGDVYVVQPTGPPVNERLVELLLLLDACRRGGADRITAVVPYLGYARQDRRLMEGQSIGVRVCAQAMASAGADRLVVIDPHTAVLEAMCPVPVETLTAVPVLVAALKGLAPETVVVAPDLGAVKLAERFAAAFGRSVAIVRKTRLTGSAVSASELIGDVAGRPSVIVDDMITTGATVEAALGVLRARGSTGTSVAAVHGVLVEGSAALMAGLGVRRVIVTDTLDQRSATATAGTATATTTNLEVHSVALLLAEALRRLNQDEPLGALRLVQ